MSRVDKFLPSEEPFAVMANDLITASYELTVAEHRLIKSILAGVNSYKDSLSPTTKCIVSIREYATQWKVHTGHAKLQLLEAIELLKNRLITKQSSDKSFIKLHWVSEIGYIQAEESIYLVFSPQVIPLLTLQREYFTKLDLNSMVEFKSSYTFRLYELLVSAKGFNNFIDPKFEVEKLCEIMDVPTSYREYKVFKPRVLSKACSELKSKVTRFSKLELIESRFPGSKRVKSVEFKF